MKTLWNKFLDVLLSTDRKRRTCTAMTLLGMALALMGVGTMGLLVYADMTPQREGLWWMAVTFAGFASMTLMVRLGVTSQWQDPAMTYVQIMWAITVAASGYVLAGPARHAVPSMLILAVMFSSLYLTVRQIVVCAVYALVLYTVAVFVVHADSHEGLPLLELTQVLLLFITLLGTVVLSIRLSRMRIQLRRRRHELHEALKLNQELAARDGLTGLPNRRHMQEQMELERQRCARHRRPLTLAQIDLDYFKRVNDTYGHAAGDLALRSFAKMAQTCIRSCDILARWGGEEFVIMLTDTDTKTALLILERLRRSIETMVIERNGQEALRITVSMGLAQHIPGESVEATLARADKALYQAKHAGRNRVVEARPGDGDWPCTAQPRPHAQPAAELQPCAQGQVAAAASSPGGGGRIVVSTPPAVHYVVDGKHVLPSTYMGDGAR